MAAVHGIRSVEVRLVWGECEGGGGIRDEAAVIFEESQDGRSSVELAVLATKARGGEDATPWFADSRGTNERNGIVRRKAEEDLLDKLVHQLRWRRHGETRVWVGKIGVRTLGRKYYLSPPCGCVGKRKKELGEEVALSGPRKQREREI
jgi:hypothetical protein